MDIQFPPQIHLQVFPKGCEDVSRNETYNYFQLFVFSLSDSFSHPKLDLIFIYVHVIVPFILFNRHCIVVSMVVHICMS
jgi:hypothetical protein